MAEPEGTVSSLPEMDNFQRKHPECPYFQSNRQGLCLDFFRRGPVSCFLCGYRRGLDHGYDDGWKEGYDQGREDGYEQAADRAADRQEWETEMD